MNIIITGATGMVGAEVVRQAIDDPAIDRVSIITRRRVEMVHPKLQQYIHTDFMDYSSLPELFKESDACIWCLGISQSKVSRKQYYEITYSYTVAAAKAMIAANAGISFLFLSGEGADSRERSMIRFARVKGQAENALKELHFRKLFIFRPGGIRASAPPPHPDFFKRAEMLVVKTMSIVWPWSVVSTKELAQVMLKIAKEGYPDTIVNHRAIKKLSHAWK